MRTPGRRQDVAPRDQSTSAKSSSSSPYPSPLRLPPTSFPFTSHAPTSLVRPCALAPAPALLHPSLSPNSHRSRGPMARRLTTTQGSFEYPRRRVSGDCGFDPRRDLFEASAKAVCMRKGCGSRRKVERRRTQVGWKFLEWRMSVALGFFSRIIGSTRNTSSLCIMLTSKHSNAHCCTYC